MKAVEITLRVPVHLTDTERMITSLTQRMWQLHRVTIRHLAVAKHAIVPGAQPRQQGGARRSAGRRATIAERETRALAGEPIQMRRANDRVAIGAGTVAALLIGHQQKDIRAFRRRGGSRPAQLCREHGRAGTPRGGFEEVTAIHGAKRIERIVLR